MRDEVLDRIRFLFNEAWEAGADTDAWEQGPDVVDEICDVVRRDPVQAASISQLGRDPRWMDLQRYLQGYADACDRVLFDVVEVEAMLAAARRKAKVEALRELAEDLLRRAQALEDETP